MKKNIILFLFFTILLTVISTFISELSMDSIWNFGFSYNISNGLIPYRDFNMVIGPFYNFIIAFFLKLFGNYMFIFQIVNSAIVSIVLVLIYKKIKNNIIYLVLLLGILPVMYGYNTFCAFLVLVILLLDDSNFKYKNSFIGIVIGMVIMTKHNIGFCLAIVYFFTKKNKLKLIMSMLIPIIPIMIYLVINNAFYSYIDFCYLGIGSFLENFYFEWPIIIVLLIIIILLIRQYLLTSDKKILYLLAFQIINFPLFESIHFMVSVVPIIYYIFLTKNKKDLIIILKEFIVGIFIIIFISNSLSLNLTNNIKFLKYNRVPPKIDSYLLGISDYVNKKQVDHEVYLFLSRAYLIKINLNQNITFTDLINNGNLGSNENKYIYIIDDNCKNLKCLFILDKGYFDNEVIEQGNQINLIFKDYVIKNEYYLETLPSGDRVYVNYNPEN